ncbi:hypothetical protein [Streptacidiphilus monticola]|uniref:Metal-dependent phosphohydrolase n=1 Tax=Streptacidiphilus monticola TaxID=2161674 RepID=A0ABW1G8A9_9ACTN
MASPHAHQEIADALLPRWTALIDRVREGRTGPEPRTYGEQLLRRWGEPQRRYHDLRHLRAVLHRVDQLAEFAADADSVRLAAWFHDAVYDPERSENEERSARLAERVLTELLVPSAVVEETARLVRLTADHAPDRGDANAAVLCDADLAVLAGTPEEYAAYAAAVREEYGFVPDEDFRVGRGAVLELLLAQRELFRTPPGAASWAEPARANLRAELDRLRGKVPPIG